MITILFLIFSTFIGINSNEIAHEFHLSRSTVNYNTSENSIQITMNLFIDDLELALKAEGVDSLQLCTKQEKVDAENAIQNYIKSHFIIEVDGKVISPQFLGKEQSDDLEAVWCYLEVANVEQFDEINISNTIMVDLYDDQKNMTIIQIDKERVESILFSPDKTEQKVELDD